jgi:flagellar hook-associated protein 3 FlgL
VVTGKRINRPSDDPSGADAVIRLRSSQAELEQFNKNASLVNDKLVNADGLINNFQEKFDRVRTILLQGATDGITQNAKDALATEIDGIRKQMLNTANSTINGEYVFGGTRYTAPPFDPTTGSPALPAASPQYVQIEPNTTPVVTGVIAESIFSDATGTIFTELTNASAALRGTGNPAADKATLRAVQDRMATFVNLSTNAIAVIGANQQTVSDVLERLDSTFFTLGESATKIEGADFVGAAMNLTAAQQALDATLQTSARFNRSSLLDFLG